MRARVGQQEVELAGSAMGEVMADVADDRCGVAGLFFAALLGCADAESVEVEIAG